ncbi:AAA family ATPase [Stenotrophomonas maltophilia]|uniref:AAA family ATPase n=1 Tax=Stenotrophomonas maltophilia TaxID=40324 RepID=UPI0006AC2B93|nr:AAA family ATPase [Stenotrophomonas maltophilia]KOQ70805.1 hypothetical protein ABW43_03820 [Stenotrophomonas maltophilia]
MTILQEIHLWSKSLPAWQQDAIARLYVDRSLSPTDMDDLYALAKAEVGIDDPLGRTPAPLPDAHVAPIAGAIRTVLLNTVKDVINVNALKNGAQLPIAPTGITVIYGENGAGKSGYSRIFKRACRARDRREPLLGNANLPPAEAGTAQATFNVSIDGSLQDLTWRDGTEPPEALADLSIFDSHCARAYIDNHGDFAFTPYGLDILEGLATVCNQLKTRTLAEKAANSPSDAAYASLSTGDTAVARTLRGIPSSTTADDIRLLASFDVQKQERLELLTAALAEVDPKKKAVALRQRVSRISDLRARIETALSRVDAQKVRDLAELVTKSNETKAVAELAARQFRTAPGQLSGTGNEAWKQLFEAARAFAETSHPELGFPNLPAEAPCPLCQNSLGEAGAARLKVFDEFIQAAAERAAAAARAAAVTQYRALQDADLNINFAGALHEELQSVSEEAALACTSLQESLIALRATVLQAAAGNLPWDQVPAPSTDPQPMLLQIISELQQQAIALEATADEERKAAMVLEHLELDAIRRLVEVKDAVLESMDKHLLCAKLQLCADGMETRAISRKSTELSRTTATQELADALNAELKLLKVHTLSVAMKPESPGARTQFKLILQLPGGGTPASILSEGEQRAIAIASFLAEVKLSKGRGGIVLDDPVSSLDHRRRWEVAQRLSTEALNRQVIVFTHDIYFLLILEQKAEEAGAAIKKNYIRKTAEGFGVHSDELPFDVLGTKARIGRLKQMQVQVKAAATSGDDDLHRALTTDCYGQLRLAWERCVEEVLFNNAVKRFGEGVHTQCLKLVAVTDDDYLTVEAGMSKASKFEHDAAAAVGRLPVPDPDELMADIEVLATWRDALVRRMEDIRRGTITRASLLSPPASAAAPESEAAQVNA